MASKSQRYEACNDALPALDAVIQVLNLAKSSCGIVPAQAAFASVGTLLTTVRDTTVDEQDSVELGLHCADVCKVLDRGLNGRRLDELNQSVVKAIQQLTTIVGEIERKMVKRGKRNAASRLFHAKNDKDAIAAWRSELDRILQVFNTELAINTHVMVSDIHRNVLTTQGSADSRHKSTQASIPLGESPPLAPRFCTGREMLIEKIVHLVENFTPIALIGAGGIGKTSIALTILHDDRVKRRFGENRRFIRCDQFSGTLTHFLSRLSKATGAGVENPEDITRLIPFLSSKETLLVLDNAESILDPHGTNSQEIYASVEELCRLKNICLCITSRISTIPPDCETIEIPTLSMEPARSVFHHIYKSHERSDSIDDILERLDFHPLSITLLATVAHQNKWDTDRLVREWEQRQTGVLKTGHNKSLAATIELSLASAMFKELGSDARELLGVVAFFPQGVDENNLSWLFPTISSGPTIFDAFCILSLTYRNPDGFVTMLAPLRDYLRPKDPTSSPLLCTTKDSYFTRMSIEFDRSKPVFGAARWITTEDVNVERLLDIFTAIDIDSGDVWKACSNFLRHLVWHKPRYTVLGSKIEGLPDHNRSKPGCLFELARLFEWIGNRAERKQLLTHALKLERELGDDYRVALALMELSDANRVPDFCKEGIEQAKEGLEIFGRLGDTARQAECLEVIARVFCENEQLVSAEEAAIRGNDLLQGKGQEHLLCRSHRLLGDIYRSKGTGKKAIHHFEAALTIASPFNWHDEQFWIHYGLAGVFLVENEFGDSHYHIEQAKSHTIGNAYYLGLAMELKALVWYEQGRLEDATPEALSALEIHEKLGASEGVGRCKDLLQGIKAAMGSQDTSAP